MVVRVCERAAKVRGIHRILVASDSDDIISAVKKAGFEARMTPESLKSGTDRVAYVAKDLKESVIVNLQGDEPVIAPEAVEAAMEPVLGKKGSLMGSAYTPFHSIAETLEPGNVKVILDKNSDAIYFSRHAIPFRQNLVSDQEWLEHVGKHLGIYVYQKDFLLKFSAWEPTFLEHSESLEQLRALYNGVKIGMGRSEKGGQSVDTQADLEKARDIFKSL